MGATGTRAVVGRIAYLNTEPFFEGFEADAEQLSVPPRELARLAAEGRVDAGALPVAELFRLEAEFEPLGQMGIAARESVESVLAFSRRPFGELSGARITLTTESSTSVRLFRLLLEARLGVNPVEYHRGTAGEGDACLVIGDEALRLNHLGLPGFPHKIDLAREWFQWQRLPFVFARWAVRRSLPEAEKRALQLALERALDEGVAHSGRIAERYSPRVGVPAADLKRYLDNFIYRLGPREAAAEAVFRRLIGEHRLADFDPR